MDAGLITPSRRRLRPTRTWSPVRLGVEDAVLLEVNEHRVEPGDMLFDVFGRAVGHGGQTASIAESPGAGTCLWSKRPGNLVDAANANGGRDNISVLLAQAQSGSEKRGLISRLLGK
jgi:hypothetical protein